MPQHMPLRTEHAWLLSFARDAEIHTRELERAHLLSPHPYTVAHDLSFIVLVSIYTMHGGEGTAAADTSGWDGRAVRAASRRSVWLEAQTPECSPPLRYRPARPKVLDVTLCTLC